MTRPARDGHARSRPLSADAAGAEPARLVPDLRWEVSYDLSSVRTYLAEVEADGQALQLQLQEAHARVRRAEEASARRAVAAAELGARILAMQADLESLEWEHRECLEAIESAARRESANLLARAQEQVATLRAAAEVAGGRLNGG